MSDPILIRRLSATEAAGCTDARAAVLLDRAKARAFWQRVGVVPGLALWPDGRPCDTTYLYKQLA